MCGEEGREEPLRLIYWLIRRFPQPQTTPAACRYREGGGHRAARAAGRPAGARVWLSVSSEPGALNG